MKRHAAEDLVWPLYYGVLTIALGWCVWAIITLAHG